MDYAGQEDQLIYRTEVLDQPTGEFRVRWYQLGGLLEWTDWTESQTLLDGGLVRFEYDYQIPGC